MITPHVTELPLSLAAVTPDPFVDRGAAAAARREERLARERRVARVRDLLRDGAARNGGGARRTARP